MLRISHALFVARMIGFFYFACANASNGDCDPSDTQCKSKNDEHSGCTLYLAKSTIPNAGLGLFTGKSVKKEQNIGFGDPAIPILDIDFHNGGHKDQEDYHWLLSEYEWKPIEVGPFMENEGEEVNAFAAGMGAAPNCHFRLKNIAETHCEYDTAGITRTDPGIGAFTGYHNRASYALEDLVPGQELFVDYGTHWFLNREDYLGLIPLEDDYEIGQDFIDNPSLQNLIVNILSEDAATDFWDILRNFPYKSRPLSSLPRTLTHAKRAIDVGIHQTELEESILSMEYLKKHGKCLDNIKYGKSTIPHAGRGAFATRFLPEGSMISPAPLLHIPDKDSLNMYAEKYDEEEEDDVRDTTKMTGKQLLLNYCFGHKSSTLLLCPYGPGTWYINHDGESPNAKIVWSEDPLYHNSSWLQDPVTSFEGDKWTGGVISFEYIALKDIQEGEEITIDYGEAWEKAWKEHVKYWVPPKMADDYIAPHELNNDEVSPLKTYEEGVYSDDIEIWCVVDLISSAKNGGIWQDIPENATKSYLKEYSVQRIIDRSKKDDGDNFYYTVELVRTYKTKTVKIFIIKEVPRRAISFYYKPYRSDMHIRHAFRHEIMIPDEIFPDAWRNID